jgi:glycosyltransferase involved in cell wall biosynthesis
MPAEHVNGWATTVVVAHPGSELYGADRMVVESAAGLLAAGCRVVVTVPGHGPLVERLRDLGAEVVVQPVAVVRKSALTPVGLARLVTRAVASFWPMVRHLRRCRADVVYVSTVTIPLWLVAARLLRVPTVVHVHEAERSAPGWAQKGLNAPLLLAHRIIVNSEFSRDVLKRSLPRKGSRSIVVQNGVEGPERVPPPRETVTGPLRLLFLGRLSPRKGPHVAVEAVAILRSRGVDVVLDLVGDVFEGYEWYRDQLVATIDDRGLGSVVHLHGFRDTIWPALAECDVLLVPSTFDEPFGNTAVEGILSGRPLVVTRTGGLLEAAGGYGCVTWADPDDADDLARAVVEVGGSWQRLSRRALADAQLAAERHAPQKYRAAVAALTVELA